MSITSTFIQIALLVLGILIFLPIILFMFNIIFSMYNRLYIMLVGQGNKWYQNLFLFPVGLLNVRKRRYVEKNYKNGTEKNHIAIVIANNYFPENIMGFGLDVIVKLIKYLKTESKNYRVYNKVTSEKIREIIVDKKVKSIFLFGHGERHGIKVGKNEAVYYCEFPNHPKKELIAQFHCNHLKGKSLAEYGKKPIYSFITDNTQNQFDIERQLNEIIEKKLIK